MSIRYRLKRSSGLVHESIPAHPDAIYRPQNRPIPVKLPPADSDVIGPRLMDVNPAVAAPLTAGGSEFSLWWIIGPLIALLAAMALAALVYAMKKKHDSKKQDEEEEKENDPEKINTNDKKTDKTKEKNSKDDDNAKKLPINNVTLRNMKSDSILKEQKRSVPISSAAKGSSTLDPDPFDSNQINNKQFDKSPLPAHDLSRINDTPLFSSTRLDNTSSLANMTKPNSDTSKQFTEKKPSKTVQDSVNNPLYNSSVKNIRSIPTHKTESRNMLPASTVSSTSSITSNTQKPAGFNDESEYNSGKLKSDAVPNKKGKQVNDSKKLPNDKSQYDQNLTNFGRVDQPGPLNARQNNKELPLTSSHSGINDSNIGKLKSEADPNRNENQPNDTKKLFDYKSPFDQGLTKVDRARHSEPLKPEQSTRESSLPTSSDGINDSNADKLKSNADSNKKENQPNDNEISLDDKSPFDQRSTNLGRTHDSDPLKVEQNNKELPLPVSSDGINDSNIDKLKSNTDSNRKENQPNDSRIKHNDQSASGQSLASIGRADQSGLLKVRQSSGERSSDSGMNDQSAINGPDNDRVSRSDSPEEHGIGKSPLISNIPTGSKHSGKERSQSRTNQSIEEETSSIKSSSLSNLNLKQQGEHSSKENTHPNKLKNLFSSSDMNKDKQASTLTSHSKHDSLSESSETIPSNDIASAEPTNEKNSISSRPKEKSSKHTIQPSNQFSMLNKNDSDQYDSHPIQSFPKVFDSNSSDNHLESHIDSSNPQKSNKPVNDKSDESNTSLTKSNLTNYNRATSFMPNVPQCKTNTSSDDDDYDEVYSIPFNNSSIQQTTLKDQKTSKSNSNLNKSTSIYRKTRILHMRKSLTKRFYPKDKI